LDAAIADARTLGLRNLVVINLLPGERRTLDDYKRFAEQMRIAVERCGGAGLALHYHPHSFEYEPLGGSVPIEMLAEQLSGANSGLEVDVFWVAMAGRDPAEFIRRHAASVRAIHLKDRLKSAPIYTGPQYEAPAGLRVPIGSGSIDFRAVIDAVDTAVVSALYIEDESAGDRLDNTLKSVAYLRGIGV
jgi:sugar phosphate isomerase/epimerase